MEKSGYKIIFINGNKMSGKLTAAIYLSRLMGVRTHIIHFADPLKRLISDLSGIKMEPVVKSDMSTSLYLANEIWDFTREDREKVVPIFNNITLNQSFTKIGTDLFYQLNPKIWTIITAKKMIDLLRFEGSINRKGLIIISDLRMPHEYEFAKSIVKGKSNVIKIISPLERSLADSRDINHKTEQFQWLENLPHYRLNNLTDKLDLKENISKYIEQPGGGYSYSADWLIGKLEEYLKNTSNY